MDKKRAVVGVVVAGGVATVALVMAKLRRKKRQSPRLERLMQPALPYLDGVLKAFQSPYEASSESGYILLAVAENTLAWSDVLKPRVEASLRGGVADDSACYGPMGGSGRLTGAVASFLSERVCHVRIEPSQVVCMTGVAAVINGVFSALCEEGDDVLVPAPYYSAFDSDLRNLAGCRCVPCDLDALEEAWTPKCKALLLTNPHNPTGNVMSRPELQRLADWCAHRGMHLVSDEIYALSVYRDDCPRFVSVAELDDPHHTHHVLWGLSKDFGMSGLRFGCLFSRNQDLVAAMNTLAIFSCVPGVCQHLVADLLEDRAFCDDYVVENNKRLAKSCDLVQTKLDALSVPYVAPKAGMFLWFDLGHLLASRGGKFQDDMQIYQALMDQHNLILTPGSSQHMPPNSAWFRICFAYVSPNVLSIALDRLATFLHAATAATDGPTRGGGGRSEKI